ncbi:hypothetical protein K2173_019469 [Erythroxylum novogranatense]|uniref:Rab-GAP TBC domain-containing protein n=1 Tax=Erythroxylum novogranatense TaxID=1862640 RepID=A0AAV8UCN5_9ROSI|nr:hypothetical protein K2173_019469 [Erythroxylum novogranatense]
MADNNKAFLVEHRRRDSYGFALRPQHIERYREYVSIYKEEEGERSSKWKNFLDRQLEYGQSCSCEEECKEKSQGETTECALESVSNRGREGDYSSGKTSDSDGSTKCGPETVLQLSEEDKEEVQCMEELKNEVQSSKEPQNEVQHLGESGKEAQHSEQLQKDVQLSEEPKIEVQSAEPRDLQNLEDSQKEAQFSEKLIKEVPPSEVRKEDSHSKETKASKIKKWSLIRPSLHAIENLMSFRVKNSKEKKNLHIAKAGGHLPLPKEMESQTEEDVEEEICVKEILDENFSTSAETSSENTEATKEPFFPWKEELEFLVHGGVPKDLRGEVWQAFVGVKARRVERYYEELLAEELNVGESDGVPIKWKRQIEKDIPRTFPGHPALDDHGRDSLRRLLLAYAKHNPSVGYCQAMNFFAGLLLLLMPEENAFWTFVGIIDEFFDGYYTEEMIESQVDQLVFEELMRERFPKLVNHLDYLGVQVTWLSGPWFLSIFVNMLPWESVLRIWDVLLFEGNRVMLFRTALALMELYSPALLTTKDAGDAITLLQNLAGSTFDSSQLVLTACMGFLAVTEARLQEMRKKHRPAILEIVEERFKKGRVWNDSKGLASKLYSFKHDHVPLIEEEKIGEGEVSQLNTCSSNLDDFLIGLSNNSEADSLPDLQEQVVWMKVELCRLLDEKRSAILRAEELETALVEMVKEDNRRELTAKIELLEQEVAELRQALADKKEQEYAMLQVLMRVEQEQRITEEARLNAEQAASTQKNAVCVLQEKYDKAMAKVAQMEQRVVMAESMLEATIHYESGQARAVSSPRSMRNPSTSIESPRRRISLFGLGWRDRNKGKPVNEDSSDCTSSNDGKDSKTLLSHNNNKDKRQQD